MSFKLPVELVPMPGTDWLWMVELRGAIYAFNPNAEEPEKHLVIHLKSHAKRMSDVYGLAFHPDFEKNRQVYLCYVLGGGAPDATRVSKFVVSNTSPPSIIPESEEILLTWKGGGHNGGCLKFGPDGYLYITTGDGTGPNPPDILKTGQDISDLLASVLRIDVDQQDPGLRYAIPGDNPFVHHPDARPEIWAFGFRNPFKMSFDSVTGDLWVGDVGWELWELIHRVEKGGNYGWSIMEGNHMVQEGLPQGPGPILPPIVEHPHSEAASITGGYVYHGTKMPKLRGAYVYSDYETGKIWALRTEGNKAVWNEELVDAPFRVITFGEDKDGELWIVDYGGGLYQLIPHSQTLAKSTFPHLISQTGVFEDVANQSPAPWVYPYNIEMPHWENGAMTRRWVGIPDMGRVRINDRSGSFPENSVLVKTLFWPDETESKKDLPGKPIETQLLHFDGQHWNAYAYAWNASGEDAELVEATGKVIRWDDPDSALSSLKGQQVPLTWKYESRANCLRCHNSWSGYALGWNKLQLHGTSRASKSFPASRTLLAQLDLINDARPPRPRNLEKMSDLEYDARAYLHANCGHCHRENAGAMVKSLMYFDKTAKSASLINQPTLRGNFGLPNAAVIVPGDPFRSVLYCRMAKTGGGQMPHLGMQGDIDRVGLYTIFDWIRSMDVKPANKNNLTSEILRSIDHLRQSTNETSALAGMSKLSETVPGVLGLAYALDHDIFNSEQRDLIQHVYQSMNDAVSRDVLRRFFETDIEAMDALDLVTLQGLSPNIENGRRMFFEDATLQCGTCHRIGDKGGALGPDLSRINEKYNLKEILEHIMQPSLLVEPEFQVTEIETENGFSQSGIIQEETNQHVVLMDILGQNHHIEKSDMIDRQKSNLSAMPEGLLEGRNPQEAADLLGLLGYLR